MTENDRQKFNELIAVACEFYDRELSEGILAMYWELLEDWDCRWVELGMKLHMKDPDQGRFFPKPAHLKAAWLASDEYADHVLLLRDQQHSETRRLLERLDAPEETPVDRTTPRIGGPEPVSGLMRQLPWEKLGVSRAEWMRDRYGDDKPAPATGRQSHPACEDEWTRERAQESLKGRKAILQGYS